MENFIEDRFRWHLPPDRHDHIRGQSPQSAAETLLLEKVNIAIQIGSSISLLDAMLDLLHLQVQNYLSNAAMTAIMQMIKKIVTSGIATALSIKSYQTQFFWCRWVLNTTTSTIVQRIVPLFYGEFEDLIRCRKCGTSRYKEHIKGEKLPKKVDALFTKLKLSYTISCSVCHSCPLILYLYGYYVWYFRSDF